MAAAISGAPTGLALLVDEKRVNDLLAQKSGAKAALRSACNVILFLCFLALFTVLALSEPLQQQRSFEGYVRRRFDSAAPMPLRDVSTIDHFWEYLDKTFLPGLYGNDTDKYFIPTAKLEKLLPLDGSNRLLGVARMRMLRVAPNRDCSVADSFSVGSGFSTCYGAYSSEADDRKPFGPINAEGEKTFSWLSDPTGEPYRGKISTYNSGGFMTAFTAKYNESMAGVQLMKDTGFLDVSTRAVFLDFTIINMNLGLYAVSRIIFEAGPSGQWVNNMEVEVLLRRHLTALGYGTTEEWAVLVGEGLLVLFVLRYLLEEAAEFIACEGSGAGRMRRPQIKTDYFLDAWNLVDWSNLLLVIVALGLRVSTWSKASNLQAYVGDPSKAGLGTFTDLSGVASNVRLIRNITAFNTVLTWFKAVKYINIIPYITLFMQTVSASQDALVSFIVVLCTILAGFVLGYSVAFGEQISSFRTPWKAFVFMMRTFLGDANMGMIYDKAPFLGSLLIILYILGIFFVILNLFYAIILSALSDAKASEDMKQSKKWAQTLERTQEFWATVSISLRLEYRFKTCFPGLYSRWLSRKRALEKLEKARDDAAQAKLQAKEVDIDEALGPGSPQCGRRQKRPAASLAVEDNPDSDSEDSEIDLGPLRHQDQLSGANKLAILEATGGKLMLEDQAEAEEEEPVDPQQEAIELVISATRHVAKGIVERTQGARNVLFREMAESKEVLDGVSVVLEVLGRRARDLEAQQRQMLKQF